MNKKEKYILYGASFNPPHIGHYSAISQMLEEHDKVVVFPYPKKYVNGKEEILPPIGQRMKMLEIFALDFFPQMSNRLIILNLAAELNHKDRVKEGVLHTYDYLQYVKERIPVEAVLSVCLGFDAQNVLRKEKFFNEDKIKSEFKHFYLQEENTIKSQDLRDFFSKHKTIKTKAQEEYLRGFVGNALAEYIFKNNLYGLKKEKTSRVSDEQLIKKKKI